MLPHPPSIQLAQIPLPTNLLLPFITSHPYNYHHPLIITQPLLKHHLYTSIHIQHYQSQTRDTKLPPQEITHHIPNLSHSPLKN
ncbi:hypothetical protein, partial [Staphylococcus saprophyticus]|uniref:hypothetical protein n=1 Tax=Staphylococcus saprophyticus TaxID=29385 RepID=UPI001CD945D7